jgi:hypothetical protein
MNQPEGFTPNYNSRPANVNRAESFIAISFTHENNEEYRAATSIRERSGKILCLIFSLDKSATLNPAYNEQQPPLYFPLIKTFPTRGRNSRNISTSATHRRSVQGMSKTGYVRHRVLPLQPYA